MADQSIIIKATAGDKTVSTSITNVNPDATNAQMIELAQKFNALTTNTLSDVSKVVKSELKHKSTPEFLIRKSSGIAEYTETSITFTRQEIIDAISDATLKYTGNGKYYVKSNDTIYAVQLSYYPNSSEGYRYTASVLQGISDGADPGDYCDINNPTRELPYSGTIVIGATETDEYEPAEVTINITATTNNANQRLAKLKGGTVNG